MRDTTLDLNQIKELADYVAKRSASVGSQPLQVKTFVKKYMEAYTEAFKVNDALSFNLHVGADSSSDNKIKVDIASMSAAGIGVKGIKVNTTQGIESFS